MIFRSLALALLGSATNAFPTGPGGCETPSPFAGSHTERNPDGNGTLADGGFSVTLGGEAVTSTGPPGPTQSFTAGQHTISLSGGSSFLGFLIRVSADGVDDTLGFLSSEEDGVMPAIPCESLRAGSLGHTDNMQKTEITGTLDWPAVTEAVNLDVSVVVSNSAQTGSVYYTSNFVIETTEAAADEPSAAPVAESASPVAGSMSPVAGSVSPVAGSVSPVAGSVSPVAGSESPVAGSVSPVAGSVSPVAGSVSPVAGSVSPVAGSVSPVMGSISPVAASESPVAGSVSPVAASAAPSTSATSMPSSSPSTPATPEPTPEPTQMPVSTGNVAMKEFVASVLAMGLAAAMVML